MQKLFFIVLVLTVSTPIFSQGTAINDTGDPPDASAILDVSATDKGVLIPRLTTALREGIASPATGLLVFDTDTESFWYHTASDWVELVDNVRGLQDADHDTKVQVEESPDEDIIRFDVAGTEAMVLSRTATGATRLDLSPNPGLFIGRGAGSTSVPGSNTMIGYGAGQNSSTGERNVFIGHFAGQSNGAGQSDNVLIGHEAGLVNNAWFNTLIGTSSGYANTLGQSNSFLGFQSGYENTEGHRNTFLGQYAGRSNTDADENTFAGFGAGYYNNANHNAFFGFNAGVANRTGIRNVALGAFAAGTPVNNRNMGNDNAIVGFQAGYNADDYANNVLVGYRAGFSLNSGSNNVFLGHEAGMLSSIAYSNVAVGIDALRSNANGHNNVAVGDSALMFNTGSSLVAVGSKAGLSNTTGTRNTFLGFQAGASNSGGQNNVFVGSGVARSNTAGNDNIFVGVESAYNNTDGSQNIFMGSASGFRNDRGDGNIFLGFRAAENNISGNSNIAIGVSAMTNNQDGSFNIGIGELALGANDGVQEHSNNIGIGHRAGFGAIGGDNIIIGNESGVAIQGADNIILGNDASAQGQYNTLLGSETAVGFPWTSVGGTAIGYGATVTQSHSVIVGDHSNAAVKVGVGTLSPTAKLHVNGSADSVQIFRVTTSGATAFRVHGNQGAAIGTNDLPEDEGLLVQGNSRFRSDVYVEDMLLVNTTAPASGYAVSVNGGIACEEVRVQDDGLWPDYVFAEDYTLMPIGELRAHLKTQRHLPGIPSAAEIEGNGFELGDMQRRLLEKVEELTLYILELEDRIAGLESK